MPPRVASARPPALLLRVVACATCALACRTALALPPDSADKAVQEAVANLDADSYHARQRATQWLREQGAAVIPPLEAAAASDKLEVTCRAIQVLRDLSVERDIETADAAGDALERLAAAGFTSSSQRASIALRFHSEARSRRALEEVQNLGATHDNGDTFQGQVSERLLIGKNWTGGDQGLAYLKWLTSLENLSIRTSKITDESVAHLKTLTNLARLELYGTRISDAGLADLQQALPHTTIDRRAGALLGIKGMANANGCEIMYVKPDSAAEAAGLEQGDVIVQFGDQPIESFESLTAQISKHAGGDKVPVKFMRGQQLQEAEVTLGEWE